MTSDIGIRRKLAASYDEAMRRTIEALKAEGFGVLTQIDVKDTLKQKLGVEFRRYMILGACNPSLAHRALTAQTDVGLLLPCNVTVSEEADGVVVTAVDPIAMLGPFANDAAVAAVAHEARAKLQRAIAALG